MRRKRTIWACAVLAIGLSLPLDVDAQENDDTVASKISGVISPFWDRVDWLCSKVDVDAMQLLEFDPELKKARDELVEYCRSGIEPSFGAEDESARLLMLSRMVEKLELPADELDEILSQVTVEQFAPLIDLALEAAGMDERELLGLAEQKALERGLEELCAAEGCCIDVCPSSLAIASYEGWYEDECLSFADLPPVVPLPVGKGDEELIGSSTEGVRLRLPSLRCGEATADLCSWSWRTVGLGCEHVLHLLRAGPGQDHRL